MRTKTAIIKTLAVGGLASLIMANSASARSIAPADEWEEYGLPEATRFEFHVVPMPAMPGDADLPEYIPTIQDFVPCKWVVPIIPIMQERENVMTDSDSHDPIITGYRSGSPQCVPELYELRGGWR